MWKLSNGAGQWILKGYYRNDSLKKDRLATEFNFLRFLCDAGVRNVARPIGIDSASHRALYSFLPGARPSSITRTHIAQAAAFILEINKFRHRAAAAALPAASESCFSLQEQLELTQCRLNQLTAVPPLAGVYADAQTFLAEFVQPCWRRVKEKLLESGFSGASGAQDLPALRILSPSDFGFHNTLEDGGNLQFVDFEYAGWDDAAKLICDFICQPEMPVSTAQGREFMALLLQDEPSATTTVQRVEAFLPIHRLRWVCILLNEFRSEGQLRRQHAGVEPNGLLASQLLKAEHYFHLHLTPTT